MSAVTVVGAGLAGSECAWQLARRGIDVRLVEMKPGKYTPAHVSPLFGELVCSNSLRGDDLTNAVGLLKEEMRRLGSLIMESAEANRVAAGGALAVDREGFARYITDKLRSHPHVEVVEAEAADLPEGDEVVIATGPLTSDALAGKIAALCGEPGLHFYDAVAPIVTLESVDMENAYLASRYGKGTADYVNCPITREEYTAFVSELRAAKEAPTHGFDDGAVFEGCMPVEVMARRGEDTLRYGPMKPVGLINPNTGAEDYAVHVFVSREGYLKKITPQSLRMSSEQKYKEGDGPGRDFEATNRAEILVFTNRQQAYKARLADFADAKASVLGTYLPSHLGMDEGEAVVAVIAPGDYSRQLVFFFENGKAARVPLSAYETKTNRKKLVNAYSDKSPISCVLELDGEIEIAAFSTEGRALIFNSALLAPKASRSTQGVGVMTMKPKYRLTAARPLHETGIKNLARYRVRSLPAAGALLRDEDRGEKQMSLLEG